MLTDISHVKTIFDSKYEFRILYAKSKYVSMRIVEDFTKCFWKQRLFQSSKFESVP